MKVNVGGGITLECDECGEQLSDTFHRDDFRQMVSTAKAQGWQVSPDGEGGWSHKCSGCKDDPVAVQRKLLGL